MNKKHLSKPLIVTVLLSFFLIGWSVEANYQLNLKDSSTNQLFNQNEEQDYGISPLVTNCNTPFSYASAVPASTSPLAVASGDFNNDGNPDLAVANNTAGTGTVSIRLNDGRGSFTIPATPEVNVGTTPTSVAVGDFNGDGKIDFATANSGTGQNSVSIRLGNGDGSFTAAADVAVGTGPRVIALGDYNNDGNLDLAVANITSANVSIRLGNGNGTFSNPPSPIPSAVIVGTNSLTIAAGDFNNDGNLDFAAGNFGSASASIRLGNGDGSFTAAADVAVGAGPFSIAVGDINNDGYLDFATANQTAGNVSIRLGNGDGTFSTAPANVTVGTNPRFVALGDFNRDGKLDFAAANNTSATVSIRLGNGDGSFTATVPDLPSVTNAQSVALADYNSDGNLDVAYNNNLSNNVAIRLGDGTGGFNPLDSNELSILTGPRAIAVGDINNDSNPDFVVANNTSGTVSVRLGNDSGGFTAAADVTVGTGPISVAIADFNNDGKRDFVAANSTAGQNSVSIRLGNNDGTFTSPATPQVSVGVQPFAVAVADFNKDGKMDFVTANRSGGSASVRFGNGAGAFVTPVEVSAGSVPSAVVVGDFNNDGNTDFAIANSSSNTISIRLGNGGTGFTNTTDVAVTQSPQAIAVGDFNADGKLDFIAGNSGAGNTTVSLRLGAGTGAFTVPTIAEIGVARNPISIAVADFNKDGELDFVTANNLSNTVSVVFGSCAVSQKRLVATAGTPQSANINAAFGTNFKVTASNNGTPVAGASVTFMAPAIGASGTFGGSATATVTTDANGVATAPAFTANGIPGNYQVVASVTISGTIVARAFYLTNRVVCSTITLSTSLPNSPLNTAYNQTITGSGGSAPYSFFLISGSLPTGLTLNPTGLLSGTTTVIGSFSFTIRGRDRYGCSGSQAYSLVIGSNITAQTTVSVTSTNYSVTVSPSYVGTYAIATSLKNNGSALAGPIYFQIFNLSKVGTDLDPTRPNRLLSADNGAGVNGDLQTVSTSGISSGGSIPVTFNVGLGSRQTFNFFVNLYNNTSNRGAQSSIAQYQFTISEGRTTSALTKADSNNQFDLTLNTQTADNAALISGAGAQSRPVTAIDANNNNRIAVVANDLNTRKVVLKTTQDGGSSWTTATLPQTVNGTNYFTAQNASLAYDAAGKLYLAYTVGNLNDAANALVVTSTLDGTNFDPLKVLTQHSATEKVIDSRAVIAISSTNAIYVAWDSYTTSSHNFSIKVASAISGGVFRTPLSVVTGMVSSPALAISKSGIVYLGWNNWGFSSQAPLYNTGGRIMVAASRNNGASFMAANQIGLTNIGFARNINAMPDAGVTANLTLAVDSTLESTLYAAYTVMGQGLDVVFASSFNSGQSWKTTKVVSNDVNNADQFNPTMTINKADGTIKLAFYNTSLSNDNSDADLFVAQSNNGGVSFTNSRVTTTSSNDSKANLTRDFSANLGDRVGIAIQGNVTVVVWTDTRQGNEDIFIQTFSTNQVLSSVIES